MAEEAVDPEEAVNPEEAVDPEIEPVVVNPKAEESGSGSATGLSGWVLSSSTAFSS